MRKALTLWQPWATLVALGHKRIETRSWATRHRGELWIHAAKRPPEIGFVGDYQVAHPRSPEDAPWQLWTHAPHLRRTWEEMPLGAVVALAHLVDVLPMIGPRDATPLYGRAVRCYNEATTFVTGDEDRQLEMIDGQVPYGDFAPGRFAWFLEDVVEVEPVPCRGGQRIWNWRP